MKKLLFAAAAIACATPVVAADMQGGPYNYSYNKAPSAYSLFNWTGFYVGGHLGYGWGAGHGAVGGVQAGYNYQFPGSNIVVGGEADITLSGMDNTSYSVDYLGSLRARAGIAMERFMVYGTAGLGYGKGEVSIGGLSNSQTHFGLAIGAGVEGAITPNVTARLEYLYYGLGSETYSTVSGPLGASLDASVVRIGLNYKF
jgi:outer membrane immunogenic protein